MKYISIFCAFFLFACQKTIDRPEPQTTFPSKIYEKQICSFNLTEFNMVKRPPISRESSKGRPKKQDNSNGTTTPTSGGGSTPTSGGGTTSTSGSGTTTSSSTVSNVILIDFNGHIVSGTTWNVYGDINCAPANLTDDEASVVLQRITADFAPFNVVVTTDESIYANANPYKRMRVIVTESWEWYGMAGGVAILNSFSSGKNTPCFVFSSLLGYNVKKIAEACSHESGHTLGLRHQSTYDANGVKLSDYNSGTGSGEIGWAPIMGVGYSRNLTLWHNGPNSVSSTTMQNDVAIIGSVLGFINDDYANTTSNAAVLESLLQGIINSNNDLDFFSVNLTTSKNLTIVPKSVGPNNEGGNLDLTLYIYDSQGVLLSSANDPNILSASATLPPGNYYIAAGTTDNFFTTKYGMESKYTISIN